jgi:hemerythrin
MYACRMDSNAPGGLGDPGLDEDHARLHECIVRLLEAPAHDVAGALDALHRCASAHFEAEDADLRGMRDGNAQCHLDEHGAVLKSLAEVRAVLVADQLAAPRKRELVRRLGVQLLEWLPHHVQEMDAAVARWRVQQRFGGAPVQIARRQPG